MSRISRRKWTAKEYGTETTKGVCGLMDAIFKENLRITDDEYDFIAENATDDELFYLLEEHPTFAIRRKIISIVNEYTNEYSKIN